jgi:hypothetical protein
MLMAQVIDFSHGPRRCIGKKCYGTSFSRLVSGARFPGLILERTPGRFVGKSSRDCR